MNQPRVTVAEARGQFENPEEGEISYYHKTCEDAASGEGLNIFCSEL
jgi:hypothetical protein